MAALKQNKGLARAKEIYRNRDERAKELKKEGKKIIGYFCCYPPLEIMTALDFVPFRILGDMREPITAADSCLPTIICPFTRSCMDLGLKGRYDFLDGVVGSHSCDTTQNVHAIWRYYLKPVYSHFLDVPHVVHQPSVKFFKAELATFKKTLEEFAGREISLESLRQAIKVCNEQRALVRELYELRKAEPPPLSGTEMTQIVVALLSLPVAEGIELLKGIIEEVKERRDGPQRGKARVLVWGTPIDDMAIVELIEDCGANIVMDDTCIGSRFYWHEVELTEDPLDGLAARYLDKIYCPRIFRETGETRQADLERRFGYLRDFARDWKAQGVILQVIKYCDIHGYELPDLGDYLRQEGFPALPIEHDYNVAALEPLRTRLQAFIEMLG
jgi:bzd-type benzoyl-CoA reductase N subunit